MFISNKSEILGKCQQLQTQRSGCSSVFWTLSGAQHTVHSRDLVLVQQKQFTQRSHIKGMAKVNCRVCVCGKSLLSLYPISTHMSAIQCVSETTVRCLPAIKLCFYWVMAQNHFELVYIRRDLEDFKNSERNAFGFLVSESDKIFILFLQKKAINKYTAQRKH